MEKDIVHNILVKCDYKTIALLKSMRFPHVAQIIDNLTFWEEAFKYRFEELIQGMNYKGSFKTLSIETKEFGDSWLRKSCNFDAIKAIIEQRDYDTLYKTVDICRIHDNDIYEILKNINIFTGHSSYKLSSSDYYCYISKILDKHKSTPEQLKVNKIILADARNEFSFEPYTAGRMILISRIIETDDLEIFYRFLPKHDIIEWISLIKTVTLVASVNILKEILIISEANLSKPLKKYQMQHLSK